MRQVPDWPFRCPREGWYLKSVEAIFAEDIGLSGGPQPLLVYGDCKKHGRVWLSDPVSYSADIWEKRQAA